MKLTTEAKHAFADVERIVAELKEAIWKLETVFETNTVGLPEWAESLDDTMSELEADMFPDLDD